MFLKRRLRAQHCRGCSPKKILVHMIIMKCLLWNKAGLYSAGIADSLKWSTTMLGDRFKFSAGQTFLFSSRPVLGSSQSPIRCVMKALSQEVKRPGRENNYSHLVSSLGVNVTLPFFMLTIPVGVCIQGVCFNSSEKNRSHPTLFFA